MSDIPLSKVRHIGNTVYLSGELGFDDAGNLPDGIEAQTHNCLSRIRETLKGEGLEMSSVVSATCYLTDKSDFAAFNAVYASYFPEPRPVRTTVEVALVVDAKVEITVIAAI